MYLNSYSWRFLKRSVDSMRSPIRFDTRRISCKNHYETLKLSKSCSSTEIRDAFITLSKKYHPDCNKNDPKAKELFVEITEAYNVLIKPSSRKDYDCTLEYYQEPSREYRPPNPHDNYEIHRWNPHSHERDPWADPSFARNRNLKKEWSEDYYGVKGFPKMSNEKVVYYCGIFLIVGLIIQLFLIRAYRNVTRISEDKYYEENRKQLEFVKARAETYITREKQIEEFKKRLGPQDN